MGKVLYFFRGFEAIVLAKNKNFGERTFPVFRRMNK